MAIVINGSGTVTGLSVGGLPDGIVDTDTLANTTVTAAKVAADVATQSELDAKTDATKLPLAGGTMTGNTLHGDNVASYYGASNDLQIYHDGTHSYIKDVGTGDLRIKGTELSLRSDSADEPYINCTENGSVSVFHNNSKKLETTATGIEVTGDAIATRLVGRGVIESSSGFSGDTFAVMGLNTTNAAGSHGAVFGSKHADSNALLVGTHDATFNSFVVKGNGKVGIGTTTLYGKATIEHASGINNGLTLSSSSATANGNITGIQFSQGANVTRPRAAIYAISVSSQNVAGHGADLCFATRGAPDASTISTSDEKFRVTADGHFIIGGDPTAADSQGSSSELTLANNGDFYTISNNSRSTAGSERQTFRSAGTQIGVISAGGSATSYGTSSDYRLKENVDYDWDATSRLKQLKPCRFNWIIDETNTLVDGFIAHEAAEVVPESIFGTKDAMGVESRYTENDVETQGDNPTKSVGDVKTYSSTVIQPQQIDQSKLVPLLVKAMQEQQTTIESLTARITALES